MATTRNSCGTCGQELPDGKHCQRCANLSLGPNGLRAKLNADGNKQTKVRWRIKDRPPASRVPVCHIYNRVSTMEQAEEGISLDAQAGSCMAYVESMNFAQEYRFERYEERGVSAFKNQLIDRPEGSRMARNLYHGDVIVITSLDRAFRSMLDFAKTYNAWQSMGVRLCVQQIGLTASPGSERATYERLQLNMIAAMSELESSVKSDRMKMVNNERRAQGKITGGVPSGFRPGWDIRKGQKKYIRSRRRTAGVQDYHWVDAMVWYRQHGLGWFDLYDRLELWVTVLSNKKQPKAKGDFNRTWKQSRVQHRVKAWEKHLNDGKPIEVPKSGRNITSETGRALEKHTREWFKESRRSKDTKGTLAKLGQFPGDPLNIKE